MPPSTRRFRMPVRTEIHSSDVSTNLESSSLLMTCLGTADPDPTNLEPRPTLLQCQPPQFKARPDHHHHPSRHPPLPQTNQKCTNLSFGRVNASKQRGRGRRRRVRERKKIAPVHRPHHSSATGSVGLLRVGKPRGHRPLTRLGSRHTYSHPIQPNPNQPHHSFIVA